MANPTTNYGWVMPTSTDLVTDLPADFAVFGQAVDTSMADLKGGTTGQILAKATNTDMDFTWVTNDVGDITAVNTTAPLAGGATSGAVTLSVTTATTAATGVVQLSDSTSTTSSVLAATPTAVKSAYDLAAAAIPKSTVTTNGDLIYGTGSSTVSRVGIGSSGQVLAVSGGVPAWTTISSGGMTLIASASPTGVGTYTFSSIAGTYKHLLLVVEGISSSAGEVSLMYRFNGDTGGNYFRGTIRGIVSTAGSNVQDTGQDAMTMGAISARNTAAWMRFNAALWVWDYASAQAVKTSTGFGRGNGYQTSADQSAMSTFFNGWSNAAAVTSITIFDQNGPYNFSNGTLKLYGVS
jgi:hypothetical protein